MKGYEGRGSADVNGERQLCCSDGYALGVQPTTTVFERALHFVLFMSAGLAFAVAALAIIERVTGEGERTIRRWHVAVTMTVFIALFAAERVYHLVHKM